MDRRWISSKAKRVNGIYREMVQIRVPSKIKTLIEERASQKGMSISEYIRSLIHKDLETFSKEGAYERTNP